MNASWSLHKKLKCFFTLSIYVSVQANNEIYTTTTNMFSFLKTGDINNTIRSVTNIHGLFTSDGSRIKYAILNHSATMRKNISIGAPIFEGIRAREAEIERRVINCMTSEHLPSMTAAVASRRSLFIDNQLYIDNAALAVIMAKELRYLNRTIQMITLIANRYQEEQEDLEWGKNFSNEDLEQGGCHCDDGNDSNDSNDGNDGDDSNHGDDTVFPLQRSQSYDYSDNHPGPDRNRVSTLAGRFLLSSGNLRQKFTALCALSGTTAVVVNGMTTIDQPVNESNRKTQLNAELQVISEIFNHFQKFDLEQREPVVTSFTELRDISVAAWRVMSMFAFSGLFRLLEGSEFAKYQYHQLEDAIFADGNKSKNPTYGVYPAVQREEIAVLQIPTDRVMTSALNMAILNPYINDDDAPAYD